MENGNNIVSREKLDQVALWLSATVSSAFFSSLERFSCVNLNTDEDDDDDDADAAAADGKENEAKDRSLTQSKTDANNLPV